MEAPRVSANLFEYLLWQSMVSWGFGSSAVHICDSMMGQMSNASQDRSLKSFPNLSDPIEQERLSPAAVGAFVNIVKMWSLKDAQALGLLATITPPRS